MKEIWKAIVIEKNGKIFDFTGEFEVSNLGRIRSLDRVDSIGRRKKGKIMKLGESRNGYKRIGLYKDGKKENFAVHRIVATAFVPNPDNLPYVNHKDENRTNNYADNLEWCTQEYNLNYGTCQEKRREYMRGRYTGDKGTSATKVVCLETKQVFNCIKDAEKWCNAKGVSHCCRGKAKSCGKHPVTGEVLHWMYYEKYLEL